MNTDIYDLDYLKNLTLLYVEDEEDTRKEFAHFLRHIFGTLVTVNNGTEALASYREQLPDVIITDICMPEMDGLSLAGEIRITDRTIPIIVLSAYEQVEYLKKSINLGITDYITKPVYYVQLLDVLLKLVHRLRNQTAAVQEPGLFHTWLEHIIAEQQISINRNCFDCPHKLSLLHAIDMRPTR